MRRHNAHVESVSLVARQLANLNRDIAFTGGAIVGLLLTDSAAPDVRPTDDVDVIVDVSRYADYASLQDELRKAGFIHDMDGPNCRFILNALKVDIMPSDGKVLGFADRWYDLAVSSANDHLLPDGTIIRLISATAFVATKLEAFRDRGNGDFVLSHDMEDVIAVVNGRSELLEEVRTTSKDVRQYICETFSQLVNDPEFLDAVGTHLLPDKASQERAKLISQRMIAISELAAAP